MFRLATRLLSFLILLVGLPAALFAQATGTISGTVTDANGAVVSGATVVLTNSASKESRRSTSNAGGFFSFSGLVSGDYSVRVKASGFKTWEQQGIHILPGDRKSVADISLAVGATNEVVTVEASASEVQVVDSGDRASVLTAKNIGNLALQGRDVTELVRTLPGFANTTGGLSNSGYDNTRVGIYGGSQIQNFNANGMTTAPGSTVGSGATDIISDGARVIDPGCNCSATQTINSDMVSEVKVSTSTFSAENSSGPVTIQAIGKSGGSDYHGSLYYHFRDSAMNSNDYQFKNLGVARPDLRYEFRA
jgi:hypothetical protein